MSQSGTKRDEEQVLYAINCVIRLNEGVGASNRSLNAILEAAKLDSGKASFKKFSAAIMSVVTSSFSHFSHVRPHLAKVRAHRDFYKARPQIPGIWRPLTTSLGLPDLEPLHMQSTYRVLFEQSMAELFKLLKKPDHCDSKTMLADEENAIRYASGYIATKLFKKFQKVAGRRAATYRECLSHMAICDDSDQSTFYEYTLHWINCVNRGGLFSTNDATFRLFKSIELRTQELLPMHLKKGSNTTKEEIMRKIVDDETVQLNWSVVAVDIFDEEDANDLLKMFVGKWVSVRGFTLASMWIEEGHNFTETKKLTYTA